MKRIGVLFTCFFLAGYVDASFAQDLRQPELVKTFAVGAAQDEFGLRWPAIVPPKGVGPTGMGFDTQGRLYVHDQANDRITVLSPTLERVGSIQTDEWLMARRLEIVPSGVLAYYYGDTAIIKYGRQGSVAFSVHFGYTPDGRMIHPEFLQNGIVVLQDLVLGYLADGRLMSIQDPGPDPSANAHRILGHDESVSVLRRLARRNPSLTLEGPDRLWPVLDGEFLVRDLEA